MALDNNNLAIALVGIITQVDDNDTTNNDNDLLDVDVPIEDSFNDDNSVELEVEDSLNSDDDGNFSGNSWDASLDVEDSLNGNGDNRDNDDNGNNRDNDYSTETETEVEVEIEDSLNDNGNFRDNDFSTEFEVKVEDAFKAFDDDVLDFDNVGGLEDILTAGGDLLSNAHGVAVFGDGNAFDIEQSNKLYDQDDLYHPKVSNFGHGFEQEGESEGGHSHASSHWDDAGTSARVAADSVSSADGLVDSEAFTQNIVMGANIQYNSVDMSVVGGAGAGDAYGDAA